MSVSKTHLLLAAGVLCGVAAVTVQADTLAYWRMEGTAGADVTGGATTGYQLSVSDSSGNGNHLSVWSQGGGAGFQYRADVPFSPVPQSGSANNTSIKNTGGFPASHTHSDLNGDVIVDVEAFNGAQFTFEASYKPENGGFRTFLGRDGRDTATAIDANLAPMYFQLTPDNNVAFKFADKDGFWHEVFSAAGSINGFDFGTDPDGLNGTWYNFAATSDGSTLRLYIDGVEVNSTDLTLSGSGDTSMAVATTDGPDWRANAFTVGRGLYNGGHGDRGWGFIDEVRISNEALAPNQLLANVPEPGSIALLTLGGLLIARRRRS